MEVPQEILDKYLERRKKDIHHCYAHLEQGNYSELEKVGHQLKGNGETFGHFDLSAIGKDLEQAAHAHDQEKLLLALKDFSSWVQDHLN